MTVFRLLTLLVLILSAPVGALAAAGPTVSEPHVVARLIADTGSISPGQSFLLGVHYKIDPKWHIYWKNPGDTGLTTNIEWELPEGFEVGEIQWPTPQRYTMFGLMNYVHEKDVVLFAEVRAPDSLEPAETIPIGATTDWLVCEDVCIPGGAELTLGIPTGVSSQAAEPEISELFQRAIAQLPAQQPSSYSLAAYDNGTTIQLVLSAADGAPLPEDEALYFFEDNTYNLDDDGEPLPPNIDTNLPQPVTRISESQVMIELTKNDYAADTIPTMGGVFARSVAWGGDAQAGIELSAPVESGPAPLTASGSAGTRTAESAAAGKGLLGLLVSGFAGGLVLNLMPCVFPVLGLKILGFVNQAGGNKTKIIAHGWVFAAGVILSLWALGGAFLALRAGGEELGWGFQLQNPIVVYLTTAVLLLFGLNLSGVFEIGTSAVGVGQGLTSKEGLKGSFFSGVLATVVATPCTAPFLGTALSATATRSSLESMSIFTAIGVGLAFPYVFFSFKPDLLSKLPRPGAWMESFKQGMAFLLYGSTGYLVWVLSTQLMGNPKYDDQALLYSLFGLTLAAIGTWIFGRWVTPTAKPKGKAIGGTLALIALAGGLWAGAPRESNITWQSWKPGLAADLAADGKRVYVDFTASWCFTCQVNKKVVFGNNGMVQTVLNEDIVLLKADWTHYDERITEALARYGRNAVPFNLVYGPGLEKPDILPAVLTPGIVLEALEAAR